MSRVVRASEFSRGADIDLSEAALPIGPIAEAAFREAVTEMALLAPHRRFLRANAAMCRLLARTEDTGEELGLFVQVLDAETSPPAPFPPGLEHQPVVDFTCDRQGRLVSVSPVVKLFGWDPEELQSGSAIARAPGGRSTMWPSICSSTNRL